MKKRAAKAIGQKVFKFAKQRCVSILFFCALAFGPPPLSASALLCNVRSAFAACLVRETSGCAVNVQLHHPARPACYVSSPLRSSSLSAVPRQYELLLYARPRPVSGCPSPLNPLSSRLPCFYVARNVAGSAHCSAGTIAAASASAAAAAAAASLALRSIGRKSLNSGGSSSSE